MQAPPYALLAKAEIKSMADLKGKVISVGGDKDITRIFLERMLKPNGVAPGSYDMIFAGATGARFAALKSGAVDAAILLPPFNFYAESAGFKSLGLTIEYAKDLPFSGSIVNRPWATRNAELLKRVIEVNQKGMTYLLDSRNRDESIAIFQKYSKLSQDDVAKAYDFLIQQNSFFDATGKVSRTKFDNLANTLKQTGRHRRGDGYQTLRAFRRDPDHGLSPGERRASARRPTSQHPHPTPPLFKGREHTALAGNCFDLKPSSSTVPP